MSRSSRVTSQYWEEKSEPYTTRGASTSIHVSRLELNSFFDKAANEEDEKTLVHVNTHVYRLIDVDLAKQTFKVDMKIEAWWAMDEDLTLLQEIVDDCIKKKTLAGANGQKSLRDYVNNDDAAQDLMYKDKLHFHLDAELLAAVRAHEKASASLVDRIEAKNKGSGFFTPRLRMTNLIESSYQETYYILKEGKVFLRWHFRGSFQERFELMRFPFDEQDLTIELKAGHPIDLGAPITSRERVLKSGSKAKSALLLVKDQSKGARSLVQTSSFVQDSEYKLFNRIKFENRVTPIEESSSGHQYSVLQIKMRIKRRVGFYLINVYIPMFFVSTSLFATYVLPIEETSDRLAASLTLLLAMVAFQFVLNDKLPNISYATLIDKYMLACYSLAFATVLMQALARGGLVNEPVLTWTLTYQNFFGSSSNATAPPPPPPGANDDSDWAVGEAHVVWRHTLPREVQINLFLLGPALAWVAIHFFGILYFTYRLQRDTDAFWRTPMTAVWIGPILLSDTANESGDRELRNKFKATLNREYHNITQKGKRASRRPSLTAAFSTKIGGGGRSSGAAISDGDGGSGGGGDKERPVVFDVSLWRPQEAKRFKEDLDRQNRSAAQQVEWATDLQTDQAFAVAIFTSEVAASTMVGNDPRRILGEQLCVQNTRIEPLPEELMDLIKREGRSGGGGGRGTRTRRTRTASLLLTDKVRRVAKKLKASSKQPSSSSSSCGGPGKAAAVSTATMASRPTSFCSSEAYQSDRI